jgi:hypothetical protein
VVGAKTYRTLPAGTRAEPLGGVRAKGKEAPIEAYVIIALPPDENGHPQREQPEAGS